MRIFHKFSKIEKLLIIFLFLAVFFSISKIVYNYVEENSTSKPAFWWLYSESLVWDVNFLNPVFSNLNQVDRDISYFLFRWLMKYQDWKIVDDVATHTLSKDKLTYTFKIKDNIFWHDWKKLTADDIYYTYHDVLQNPDFENKNLALWLAWVKIKELSKNEILFTLKKPYKFFLSNLLTWILPKHILWSVPVENLKYSDFNFENPIWLGPYKFNWIQNFWNYKKVSLTKFDKFYWKKYYIQNIDFLIFNDPEIQKNSIDSFLAFWPVQKWVDEKDFEFTDFKDYKFNQRKSVWLFLNTESDYLKNKLTRLWLQLAIDKKAILKKIWESKIVNTPFLELKDDWTFDFDQQKARWALHESWWKMPQKVEIKEEKKNNDSTKYIFSHKKNIFATWSWSFLLKWNIPKWAVRILVNDYELKQFKRWDKTFWYRLSTSIWTLKEWENDFIIKATFENRDEKILDVMKIFYFSDEKKVLAKQKEIDSWELRWVLKWIKEKKEIKENLNLAEKFNFRINEDWKILKLRLITDKRIKKYWIIANELKKYFAEVWVDLEVEDLDFKDFVKKMNSRDYDILLYWQSLWYNLDTYPFFHSSEAGDWWLNFSDLRNPEFDILIEKIRSSHDAKKRKADLKLLEDKFKDVVPVIYLYSPIYHYRIANHVQWVKFWEVVNYEDRFEKFSQWYVNKEKKIKKDTTFFSWMEKIFSWSEKNNSGTGKILWEENLTWKELLEKKWTWKILDNSKKISWTWEKILEEK